MLVRRFEAAAVPAAVAARPRAVALAAPQPAHGPAAHGPAAHGPAAHGHAAHGERMLRLQRTSGNGYVQRLVSQGMFRVGAAGDRAERDADRAARAAAAGNMAGPPDTAPGRGARYLDAGMERAIQRARGRGQRLPDPVLRPMEHRLGADFGGVRLHTDAEADLLSRSLGARAFTTGSDIFFRRGGYAPDSPTGRHVLAHELAHVAQQSGSAQPVVQRYIASVNHGLRDPKGFPKDDYGTYRSLDVALHAGGGKVYKGPNEPAKGGVIDQLAKNGAGIMLEKTEDLYLVGHGSVGSIGRLPPKQVAQAIANITPADWQGQIFSMNCWSAATPQHGQSALATMQASLAEQGRRVSVTGPVGRSIRHLDWLNERESPLGMRAVVSKLTDEEETAYKDILKTARQEAGIDTEPEEAYDEALLAKFGKGEIGVEAKAAFATQWGRAFQANVVTKLRTDERVKEAIAARRVQFGAHGLDQRIVQAARDLNPGEQRVIPREGAELSGADARLVPRQQADNSGRGPSWSWFSIAGLGLIGLAAVGLGIALFRRR